MKATWASADSFKRVYEHFGLMEPNPDGMLFLGITATPNRADGQGLRDLFDAIVFDMGIQKGIADGWLCDIRGIRVSGHANLDKVKVRAGEFAQDDLEKAVNTPKRNAIIVKEWYKHAYDRRTIAFTVDVQHALDLAEAFKAHGVAAKAVWGDDPERHKKIRGHKTGEYPIIACAQLLGIGYDDPQVNCIILSAPRKSFVRYAQEVGRGTRIADGKEDLLVIDVGDNASPAQPVLHLDAARPAERIRPQGREILRRQAEARPDRGGVPHGQRAGHQEPRPTQEHRGEHQPVPAELPPGDCAAVGTGMAQERRRLLPCREPGSGVDHSGLARRLADTGPGRGGGRGVQRTEPAGSDECCRPLRARSRRGERLPQAGYEVARGAADGEANQHYAESCNDHPSRSNEGRWCAPR